MNLASSIRNWRNGTTIRKQLSLMVAMIVTLTMGLLIVYNYVTQERANTVQQTESLGRVLELENDRLDNYLSELRNYSLQLRNDTTFMTLILQDKQLSYAQRQIVESSFKTFFYSRSDIINMELYLVKQGNRLSINNTVRKVNYFSGVLPDSLVDYEIFSAAPDYISIRLDEHGLLLISRTIIDSPRKTPLAVVRFSVSPRQFDSLTESHALQDELLYLFDVSGENYTNNPQAQAVWQAINDHQTQLTLDGSEYLLVFSGESQQSFKLAAIKPIRVVNAALINTRNTSIALGFIALALTVMLALSFIHILTRPLSTLAQRIQGVGSGKFNAKADLQGSYDMIGLSEEVNNMMEDISKLIDRTYVATLNERTSRLIALEAQTNPHFLFNTLQAISTEALIAGNDNLYRMVTSLAALLRYSIKGGNLATLATELEYVEKYLLLQKARFNDRLEYTFVTDEALLKCSFPKLGLLSLVENSIVHGMGEKADRIKLEITSKIVGGNAIMRVQDNGSGISPDSLRNLQAMLETDVAAITQNIGLSNLSSRLRLLYGGTARLEINSVQTPLRHTVVSMTIPMEVLSHVSSADS